jgi:hypothetical protein
VLRIAIQHDDQLLTSGHRQSFSTRWRELLAAAGHEAVRVDAKGPDFFSTVRQCDGFMWWFAHLPYPRNLGKRLVQAVEHGIGIPVFPNGRTVWHFDDKIAQLYLLEAAGIPVPETHVFWHEAPARAFLATARYPLVMKLASGIISENVALLRSAEEAQYWVTRLFRDGTVSFARSSKQYHPRPLPRRLIDAARMIRSGALPPLGVRTELQKGYFYVQEFLEGNAFDTRVTVIGNRAFGYRRINRPEDFRASGSGLRELDPALVPEDAVRLAFRVANTLGTQSIAVDVLRRHGGPVINEISYYYEGWIVADCPGHWRLTTGPGPGVVAPLEWTEGKLDPADAILEDFIKETQARQSGMIAGSHPARQNT